MGAPLLLLLFISWLIMWCCLNSAAPGQRLALACNTSRRRGVCKQRDGAMMTSCFCGGRKLNGPPAISLCHLGPPPLSTPVIGTNSTVSHNTPLRPSRHPLHHWLQAAGLFCHTCHSQFDPPLTTHSSMNPHPTPPPHSPPPPPQPPSAR